MSKTAARKSLTGRVARPFFVASLAAFALAGAFPAKAQVVRKTPGPASVAVPATAPTDPTTAALAPARPVAERGELTVMVDRAKVIRLPDRTQTVVIGNPAIADLTVQKNGIVVVTGKSFGVTNLIALDASGNLLAESTVAVAAPTESLVVVQRGLERQSYSCSPICQPSISLGDAATYFGENRTQAEARNQFAIAR